MRPVQGFEVCIRASEALSEFGALVNSDSAPHASSRVAVCAGQTRNHFFVVYEFRIFQPFVDRWDRSALSHPSTNTHPIYQRKVGDTSWYGWPWRTSDYGTTLQLRWDVLKMSWAGGV